MVVITLSLIGNLQQLDLSLILQRIEACAKTGLLVIKQGKQRLELYFRNGRLVCTGPTRAYATLADRLLQDGLITPQALEAVQYVVGSAQPGDTRMAWTLVDLGYVTHEDLRSWASIEAAKVIQALLLEKQGEIYFEDDVQPPPERLLVSLEVTPLLQANAQANDTPPHSPAISARSLELAQDLLSEIKNEAPALLSGAQLIGDALSFITTQQDEGTGSSLNLLADSVQFTSLPLAPPLQVSMPLPPMRINVSFMRPEMVLMPLDLSALREQNPQLQITPEQWRIFTRADGHTTLGDICRSLALPAEPVCQVAGELIALGLAHAIMPAQMPMYEMSPVSRDLQAAGLGNGYVAPGYAAAPAQPWAALSPAAEVAPPNTAPVPNPQDTQSQWGNGGNGATFVPGHGWVTGSQPLQPLQPGSSLSTAPVNTSYARVGQNG